ncbi:MAG: hypothetical protein PHC51_09950 [bacterium]|nr:hypothetical protein [bacterium]
MNAELGMLLPTLRLLAALSLAFFLLQTLLPIWRSAVPVSARIVIAVMFSIPLLPTGGAEELLTGDLVLGFFKRGALLCLVGVVMTELSLSALRFFDVARGADYGAQVRNETSEENSYIQILASALLLAVVFSGQARFFVMREICGVFWGGAGHSSLLGELWEASGAGSSFVCQILEQATAGSVSLLFVPGLLLLLYDLLLALFGRHIRRVNLQGELAALKLPGSLFMIWVLLG